MAVKVCEVEKGSPAYKAGIKAEDVILTINGYCIEDVLDYRFYIGDVELEIVYERNNETKTIIIRKDEYDDIGLEFETYLMDKQHCCKNKCVFCFIDQLPTGLRDTLYFKDDDSRMSFLFGNYITLTNITEHEVDRIIKMHISPINVSVHTTNPELRVKMMKNPSAGKSLDILYRLAEAGVKINCQLVLCPGINDGEELKRSINDLTRLYPAVASIACVPVGITKYRDKLDPIEGYNVQTAEKTLDIIEQAGDQCVEKYGQRIVYASDEFYIQANKKIPCGEFYSDYDQLDNGVGVCALLKDEFIDAVKYEESECAPTRCTVATGVASYPLLCELVDIAKKKWHNIDCSVEKIVNDFFGHDITVTGLITGQDLIAQLKGKDLGKRLLLSVSMFRSEGDMMLDDITVADIEKQLNVKVVQVMNDGYELLNSILDL